MDINDRVRKHRRRMREQGVIRAQVALLDAEALGLEACFFVLIRTTEHDADWAARFLAAVRARPEDFGREFLDMIIAVRLVDGVDEAIAHIRTHGSGHTEAILTENDAAAERFMQRLDSAFLMRNASDAPAAVAN